MCAGSYVLPFVSAALSGILCRVVRLKVTEVSKHSTPASSESNSTRSEVLFYCLTLKMGVYDASKRR